MTRLVLVRHGETEWHAENRYAGTSDVALTPRGMEQAGQLAAWAADARPDAVWCSDLTRARRTAALSAEAIGGRLHVDERLRELDFGQGEGLTRAEMERKFPAALRAFLADPVAGHLPGGEDPAAAARRFTGCLDDIARRTPGGRVLVVAHSTAIRLALCRLLGVPLKDYRRRFPSLGNCALTEIRLRDGDAALLEFNTPLER
ncbi:MULTISPECIES: histidine phosphatase family protein [Actinomadura]|uniref:Probable phosphoglycerate mutase n=1 Tax=Actinomadura madurae TaxID=1993 RepID=A0A1I5YGL8_9ACTN|nr:histidine phosphatase family protein [Actinomadura madurae]SFQ43359.1 probable phosphoglycerate mutase [Actinomadura madurae]SPT58206.1 Alpha-ribazole phosphatase [Actinomadura madurae]